MFTFLLPMSFLDKFQAGARKAAIQATAFAKDSGSKLSNETRTFAQGFSLPGEAEKSAKILESFLGEYILYHFHLIILNGGSAISLLSAANPEHPESALNAIPKAVLQRARGKWFCQQVAA